MNFWAYIISIHYSATLATALVGGIWTLFPSTICCIPYQQHNGIIVVKIHNGHATSKCGL
jgi:hypothetical protein